MKKKFIVLLVLVGFIVYFNSLFNTFLWDDEEFIANNTSVQSIRNIPQFFTGKEYAPGGNIQQNTAYYRPITSTIYSVIFIISRGSPFPFRLFQTIIHIINTVLVFLVFSYFFNRIKYIPIFLSLIFLVHPINSEAVLFISATQEVLFFLVGTAALLFLIKKKHIKIQTLTLTGILLIVTLFIKETGVIFFVLIFFYLILFNKKPTSKYLVITVTFLWFYFFVRFVVGSTYVQGQGLFPIMRTTLLNRLMTVPSIILFYLIKFVFPKELAIAQHWVVYSPDFYNFFLPFFLEGAVIIIALFYVIKTKNKIFGFFLIWFLVGLLPHLQIVPLNMTVAERWFYFPMVGLLGMMGSVMSNINPPTGGQISKRWSYIIGLVIVCLLSTRTIIRTFDWRNGLTLFSHDIKLSKNVFDLENNLGTELIRVGKVKEAKIYLENSVRLAPYWWVNWNNLGVIYEREGKINKAEECYQKSINNGDYYLAYENYVAILIKQGKDAQAREFLEKEALVRFPYNERLKQFYQYLSEKR